jgi:hypothetical protein
LKKRLQNKIAESRFSLPITALFAVLVCFACGLWQDRLWIQFVGLAISALLMVQLNNSNALLRIYSRMVSCAFLVLCSVACFLFPSISGAVVMVCMTACYVTFFHAYQDKHASGRIFYTFIFIGIASIPFIQIVFFIPILWILLATNIMAFSWKSFFASIFGLIVPYWFAGGYYFLQEDIDTFVNHFTDITVFQPLFDYSQINEHQIVTFIFIAILALVGIVHFLRNSYKDKIKTRMLFEVFIVMDICSFVFIILQPQHYDFLMRIMIINTAPLIAHFVALTRTWFTNAFFGLICLAAIAITAYNLWISSLIF